MTFAEFTDAVSGEIGGSLEVREDALGFEVGGIEFFVMSVSHPGAREYLVMAADLGEVPPERPEKLYQALLDAGHNYHGAGGGTFARNPENGHIWLQWREPLSSLTVESAMEELKSLGDAALKWRDVVKDYREGAELAGEEPSGAVDGLGDTGFLSV